MRRRRLCSPATVGALAICALLALTACVKPEPVVTQEPVAWVVLLDLSGSTQGQRPAFEEGLSAVVDSMNYGDSIVVIDVSNQSRQNAQIRAEATLPVFEPVDAQNDYNVEKQRKKFEAENPIAAFKSQVLTPELMKAMASEVSSGTDLLGSLDVARKHFALVDGTPRLVILSDMLLEAPEPVLSGAPVDFRAGPPTQPTELLGVQRKEARFPDLSGVEVLVIGASAPDDARWDSVRAYWTGYMSECGANLPEERYTKQLLGGQLEQMIAK